MGAVGEGDVVIENQGIMTSVGIDDEQFQARAAMERSELEARLSRYREAAHAIDPENRTSIIVDDGLATGSTALAAIAVLRARGAKGVWLAVPVAPADSIPVMEKEADRVIVLERPRRFMAVGAWYRDFSPTSDSEVVGLLRRSRN
jgi:predicted phosphoribosyltransferase